MERLRCDCWSTLPAQSTVESRTKSSVPNLVSDTTEVGCLCWRVVAPPEQRDARLDGAGRRLQIIIAAAVALGETLNINLAVARAGHVIDFQLH